MKASLGTALQNGVCLSTVHVDRALVATPNLRLEKQPPVCISNASVRARSPSIPPIISRLVAYKGKLAASPRKTAPKTTGFLLHEEHSVQRLMNLSFIHLHFFFYTFCFSLSSLKGDTKICLYTGGGRRTKKRGFSSLSFLVWGNIGIQ